MKIVLLNLEGEDKRKDVAMGGLMARRVPFDKIEVHHGPRGVDYVDVRAVCEDAADDGFVGFKKVLDDRSYIYLNVSIAAQFWSYLKIARDCVEIDQPLMWIHDDFFLRYDWEEYDRISIGMSDRDPDWKLVLMMYWTPPEWDLFDKRSVDMFLDYGQIPVSKGLLGACDISLLMSPRGAKWLIENAAPTTFDFKWNSFETWILYLSQQDDHTGFYSVMRSAVVSVGGIAGPTYLGSEIHDAELVEKRGKWKYLIPTDWDNGERI